MVEGKHGLSHMFIYGSNIEAKVISAFAVFSNNILLHPSQHRLDSNFTVFQAAIGHKEEVVWIKRHTIAEATLEGEYPS